MIRKTYLLFLIASFACQTSSQPDTTSAPVPAAETIGDAEYYWPSLHLGELFNSVQMSRVFPDGKTFVDCRPEISPLEILDRYQFQKREPGFELKAFVEEHFELPEQSGKTFVAKTGLSMEEHVRSHWDYLTREADEPEAWSTLIPLPHSYVVPGGRFREIYYWDSYFTMWGLAYSGRMDLFENMLKNFAWLIDQLGHIPNGNRTYYLSRSQPPFFGAMVALFAENNGMEAATDYLPQLEKEYSFWMDGSESLLQEQAYRRLVRMPDGSYLNRYYDDLDTPRPESYREDVETAEQWQVSQRPAIYRNIRAAAESGWDFSSRWFRDAKNLSSIETTAILPIDLNCLLYKLESVIADLHKSAGNNVVAEKYSQKAEARKTAINKWLWNSKTNVYGDYHFQDKKFTSVTSLAMAYPLYFGVSSPDRSALVAQLLQEKFLKPGGLVTTLQQTGQQWDYPNGWAPLQWIAIKGLKAYGQDSLSREISRRWVRSNRRVYLQTGRMMEKYNVVDTSLVAGGGEYPLQDGFGWTNGVLIAILSEAK